MNTAELLPPVPKPPHDPAAWLLNFRAGWRGLKLENVEINHIKEGLTLKPLFGSGRLLAEPGGSFGGLVLPPHVAVAQDGSIYLLDQKNGCLKRFDPCLCRFDIVPCTGGLGDKPRQFRDPGGIGICGGNVFICDAGNSRVQIFSLKGFVLRSIWRRPPSNKVSQEWQPTSIAFDQYGRVLVGDSANGCIHLFTFGGGWLDCLNGFGAIKAITVDCDNHLYVQMDGEEEVRIVNVETRIELNRETSPDKAANRFPAIPFLVTPQGFLILGSVCQATGADPLYPPGVFDRTGTVVKEPAPPIEPMYPLTGEYLSEPLDSDLYRCQWDRVILQGDIPEGTRVTVRSYTAETPLPLGLIENVPQENWATNQTAFPGELTEEGNSWDCLIRSEPGRYLWIKLQIDSVGTTSPHLNQIEIKFPRISLRRYLPNVFGFDPLAADFTDRFLEVFDQTFRGIEWEIDNQARFFDPCSAPAGTNRDRKDFLSWLGSWIGVAVDRQWPVERRRRVLKHIGKLFGQRGTLLGLRRTLELYLGIEPTNICKQSKPGCGPCTAHVSAPWHPPQLILEHFKLRRWLFLGQGRLGDQAQLWGQQLVNRSQLGGPEVNGNAQLGITQLKGYQDPFHDPFHVYAHKFTVFAPIGIAHSASQRKGLQRLLETEKPANTDYQIHYVGPKFRIGIQSMIGFDSVVGCYPQGFLLDQAHIGRGTVLASKRPGGPTLEVGSDARIGTTTRLN